MTATSRNLRESVTVRILSVLCLVIILTLSGCSAGTLTEPSGQKGPVGLNVTNAANVTHTFEVFVVELPANAMVHWSDGKTGTVELGAAGIASNDPGDYHKITAVELPDSARLHGRYTLKPGETNISNISNLPDDFAVVVTIHHNDGVVSWVTATCDGGDLVYLGVTMRYYGSDSVYDCNEGVF